MIRAVHRHTTATALRGGVLALAVLLAGCGSGRDELLAEKVAAAQAAAMRAERAAEAAERAAAASGATIQSTTFADDEVIVEDAAEITPEDPAGDVETGEARSMPQG
ncbi:MAG: hypothetical protein RIQ46_1231 [Pseudomonadota bacterium]